MTYEQKVKLQDASFSPDDRLEGLRMLLDAQAHLLADHGGKAVIKEGPIKQAGQILSFARTQVATVYIREMAAKLKGVAAADLATELLAAASESVQELLGRPDKGISHAEMRSMDVIYKEEQATPDEVTTMDAVDLMVSRVESSPF